MARSIHFRFDDVFRRFWSYAILAAVSAAPAAAEICDVAPVAVPAGFPEQPINIFIPRSSASGSLQLSARIAEAIRALTDEDGNSLNIEVNLLFKFGGNLAVALEYFSELPPNGYNVLHLNDTYASMLARSGDQDVYLAPLSIAQIVFSQLYIRSDDPRFSDLATFVDYASGDGTAPLKVAKFGNDGASLGLEDFLLREFAETYSVKTGTPATVPVPEGTPVTQATDKPEQMFQPVGIESGSERYFSLFDTSQAAVRKTDALIEQPGDVSRLIEDGLIKPIFTLLPDAEVTDALRTHAGLDVAATFPTKERDQCQVHYRFRGYFVPQGLPAERRAFLEWLFLKAFISESFQEFNRQHYMDVLYLDEDVINSYCSAAHAERFFLDSISRFRECLDAVQADASP